MSLLVLLLLVLLFIAGAASTAFGYSFRADFFLFLGGALIAVSVLYYPALAWVYS